MRESLSPPVIKTISQVPQNYAILLPSAVPSLMCHRNGQVMSSFGHRDFQLEKRFVKDVSVMSLSSSVGDPLIKAV